MTGVFLGHTRIGHRCRGINCLWVANPAIHIGRSIRYSSSQVTSSSNASERRANIGVCSADTRNGVARDAAIVVQQLSTASGARAVQFRNTGITAAASQQHCYAG